MITVRRHAPDIFPTDEVPIHLVPGLQPRTTGLRRWRDRAARAPERNFFALRRSEVDEVLREVPSRPAVVLAHFGQVAARVEPLCRRLNVPLVAHFHGLDLSSSLHNNRWYRWSLMALIPRLAGAVVVGTHQQELLLELGMPASRLHLIPCGVPVGEYSTTGTGRRSGPTRFVNVSRLVPGKGVDLTLEAFARTLEDGHDARLDILGDGPERDRLVALAATLDISGRVRFHGFQPPDVVRAVLTSSDVLVQHSVERGGWVEGFGVSITEAAASGLPVVVSDCGGIRDQVRDGRTGYVVEPFDVAAMGRRMGELADDPALRRGLGDQARRQAEERFDTRNQIPALEDVLLQVR